MSVVMPLLTMPRTRAADAAAAWGSARRGAGLWPPPAGSRLPRRPDAPVAAGAGRGCGDAHEPSAFGGIDEAVGLMLGHIRAGPRITIHGDYDVDGVCATTILVGALRGLGADVDWFIPGRREDGYGLSMATVERLAARGTRLLLTADCAVTAVE